MVTPPVSTLFKVSYENNRKMSKNMFKVNDKDSRATSNATMWLFMVNLLTDFTYFSSVSIADSLSK